MGKLFYDQFDEARELYRQANLYLGFDVSALCFEGTAQELSKTEISQPALFVTSLAGLAALRKVTGALSPVAMAGLSLGELTALAAGEAFTFKDGCYLVKARGEAMAECATKSRGAMLAVIGMAPEAVEEMCRESGAWAANYNSPDQVVLSGTTEAIGKAEGLAKAKGAKRAIKLEVAGAFHSPLMQTAAEAFKQVLSKVTVSRPTFPIISNVTAKLVQDPQEICRLLVQQIVSPVRWDASMRELIRIGATHFIEFPPARVLTGLLRRIDKSAQGITIDEPKDFDQLTPLLGVRS
jgi:[acyl-carrier-protein] S-malonyltransferase